MYNLLSTVWKGFFVVFSQWPHQSKQYKWIGLVNGTRSSCNRTWSRWNFIQSYCFWRKMKEKPIEVVSSHPELNIPAGSIRAARSKPQTMCCHSMPSISCLWHTSNIIFCQMYSLVYKSESTDCILEFFFFMFWCIVIFCLPIRQTVLNNSLKEFIWILIYYTY